MVEILSKVKALVYKYIQALEKNYFHIQKAIMFGN